MGMTINMGIRPESENATEKVGSMQENFAGQFYTDQTFSKTKEKIYVGDEIFAQVTWSSKNRDKRLNFFVRNCALVQDQERHLPVVRNNCYSETMKAKLLSEEHLVSETSRLSFEAMAIDEEEVSEQRLACEIMVCLLNRCSHVINKTPNQCPTGPEEAPWKYSPYGLNNQI